MDREPLLKSPIDELHRRAGAKMVPFAGWELPVFFKGIIEEHNAVRRAAGLFDISHLGEIRLLGPGAHFTLRIVLTVEPAEIPVGSGRYTLALNDRAGIEDDLFIYRLSGDEFLLVPNAANTSKILRMVQEAAQPRTLINDETEGTALFALQGPRSEEVLRAVGGNPVAVEGHYSVALQRMAGADVLVSRSGYTGEDGFELYVAAGQAGRLWELLIESGRRYGLEPCGLGARDTLRLEMGYPLWGKDIDAETNPAEAGLMFAVDFGNESFAGRAALSALQQGPLHRKLVCLLLSEGIARADSKVYSDGRQVGRITSGTYSPSFRKGIAMGYVRADLSAPGTHLMIDVRGKRYGAVVVAKPFYRKEQVT